MPTLGPLVHVRTARAQEIGVNNRRRCRAATSSREAVPTPTDLGSNSRRASATLRLWPCRLGSSGGLPPAWGVPDSSTKISPGTAIGVAQLQITSRPPRACVSDAPTSLSLHRWRHILRACHSQSHCASLNPRCLLAPSTWPSGLESTGPPPGWPLARVAHPLPPPPAPSQPGFAPTRKLRRPQPATWAHTSSRT